MRPFKNVFLHLVGVQIIRKCQSKIPCTRVADPDPVLKIKVGSGSGFKIRSSPVYKIRSNPGFKMRSEPVCKMRSVPDPAAPSKYGRLRIRGKYIKSLYNLTFLQ